MTALRDVLRAPVVLLLAVAVFATACTGLRASSDYTVRAELPRSFNLFPGSPVKVLGVNVGTITDIEVPEGAQHVEVIMRISGDVDVPADTSAIVIPASLLGQLTDIPLTAPHNPPRADDQTRPRRRRR